LGIRLKCRIGKGSAEESPSLDRLIPNLGYIKNNIMIISHRANVIKHNGTMEEHEKICQYIKDNIKFLDLNNYVC
jgi:hypothetical protein